MRITASQLRRIIKEEVSRALNEEQLGLFNSKIPDYQAYMEAVAVGDYGGIKSHGTAALAQDLANWNDDEAVRTASTLSVGVEFGISPEKLASVTKKVLMNLAK